MFASGATIYAYVKGNPVNLTDTKGLDSETTYQMPDYWWIPGSPSNQDLSDRAMQEINDIRDSVYNQMGANQTTVPERSKAEREAMNAEHKVAKLYCDNPPPPTGDKCQDLSNMVAYHKKCANLKEQWDKNWPHPKFTGGKHAEDISVRRERAKKLQEQYDKECAKNCP